MIKIEITEPNGKTWTDDQWTEAPDLEECMETYNPGAIITIYEDGEFINGFEI